MLKGSGMFSVTPKTVVIVFIKLPNQEAQSVRFMPLRPKNTQAEKTQVGMSQSDAEEPHHHHYHPQK